MAVNVTNLIQGPANLYGGLFGALEPSDTAINASYVTTAGGFTDLGGTLDGVNLTIDQTWSDLDADQIIDVAGTRQVKRQVAVATKLAEPTLNNLATVLNDSAPTTAAASAFYEPSDGMAAFVPAYRALLFEGFSPNGRRRWVILRKVINTEGTGFAAKKDDQGNFSVTWKTFYVSSAIRPFRVVDQTA
jgi:hypothetical protein